MYFRTILLFVLMTLAKTGFSQEEKHTQVVIRMVGHEIMLASGDSSSRVLPIEKTNNTYKLRFESEFQFEPTHLVSLIDSLLKSYDVSSHYLVEVQECMSNSIVYSYEKGFSKQKDLVPCENRLQPKACYTVLISILDKSEIASSNSWSKFITPAFIIITTLVLAFSFKKRKSKPQEELASLGNFRLDEKNMTLGLDKEKIELSGKELDLLKLLLKSEGQTISKEVILNAVWGDEGDYIGRTLDVFISKLRKKLEADPNIKIINIRGVGYKLVVNGHFGYAQ